MSQKLRVFQYATVREEAAVKAAARRKRAARFVFHPTGLDLSDPKPHTPPAGTVVVKTKPHGCPRNGTMGFCYVEDATSGAFYGLVHLTSLTPRSRF